MRAVYASCVCELCMRAVYASATRIQVCVLVPDARHVNTDTFASLEKYAIMSYGPAIPFLRLRDGPIKNI
jgi:hypothetical protein